MGKYKKSFNQLRETSLLDQIIIMNKKGIRYTEMRKILSKTIPTRKVPSPKVIY